MPWSLRCLLATAVLVLAPAATIVPAHGQKAEPHGHPAPKAGRTVAGLPLFTADGKAIGTVLAMGRDDDNEEVLVAEIAQSLGFGPTAIAVPTDMFIRKPDRVELTLTEAEVHAKLGRR
jgi:hypothetical protein